MSPTSVPLKLLYDGMIRRAVFPIGERFDYLRGIIVDVYPTASKGVVVSYVDDDGDEIQVSTDGDLEAALRCFQQGGLGKALRLKVSILEGMTNPGIRQLCPADSVESDEEAFELVKSVVDPGEDPRVKDKSSTTTKDGDQAMSAVNAKVQNLQIKKSERVRQLDGHSSINCDFDTTVAEPRDDNDCFYDLLDELDDSSFQSDGSDEFNDESFQSQTFVDFVGGSGSSSIEWPTSDDVGKFPMEPCHMPKNATPMAATEKAPVEQLASLFLKENVRVSLSRFLGHPNVAKSLQQIMVAFLRDPQTVNMVATAQVNALIPPFVRLVSEQPVLVGLLPNILSVMHGILNAPLSRAYSGSPTCRRGNRGLHSHHIQKKQTKPKMEDALAFLAKVKAEFDGKPRIYETFLDVMKKFKAAAMDTPEVIKQVLRLFKGHDNLILGFNTFLPKDQRISLASLKQIKKMEELENLAGFERSIAYVRKVKERFFLDRPEIYWQFLDILKVYKKREHNVQGVFDSISALFRDEPNLLKEFTYFLPDVMQQQVKENTHSKQHQADERGCMDATQSMDAPFHAIDEVKEVKLDAPNGTIYSYVVREDYGGAPCIHDGVLSLAICKSRMRPYVRVGDFVLGLAGKSIQRTLYSGRPNLTTDCSIDHISPRILWVAKITGKKSWTQYAQENQDRPDCIYEVNRNGRFNWLPNDFHPAENTVDDCYYTRRRNMDPVVNDVLMSSEFIYFGDHCLVEDVAVLPRHLCDMLKKGPGHKKTNVERRFIEWYAGLRTQYGSTMKIGDAVTQGLRGRAGGRRSSTATNKPPSCTTK
jgi:hypothetical protein